MLGTLTHAVSLKARRQYVQTMFCFMGHALDAISRSDDKVREEACQLPVGLVFEMAVMPRGPAMALEHTGDGHLRYLGSQFQGKVDVSIRFKHIAHAFLVLSFQEKTAEAFANDRMVVDGDISVGVRMTRILNRLEAVILPKLVARRALKEYPADLSLLEKIPGAAGVYGRVMVAMLNNLRKEAVPQ